MKLPLLLSAMVDQSILIMASQIAMLFLGVAIGYGFAVLKRIRS